MKKVIYVCSALRGDIYGNTQKARGYCRFVITRGHIPLAVHLLFPQFLDEHNETERELGISLGLELVSKCDEFWVFGTAVSDGMQCEIDEAKKRGIIIQQFDRECREVAHEE